MFFLITFINGLWEPFDKIVYDAFMVIRSPILTSLVKITTWLGSFWIIIAICLIVVRLYFQQGLFISIHVVIMMAVNFIMKHFIARPRPHVFPLIIEQGYSFPSFHAMASMTLYGLIAYKLWQKNRIVAIIIGVLPIIIGITRIYLGVHYLSDVVAGWLIALCYLSILYFIHKKPSAS